MHSKCAVSWALGFMLLASATIAVASDEPIATLADLANASSKLVMANKELERVKASLPAGTNGQDAGMAYPQPAGLNMYSPQPPGLAPATLPPVPAPTYVAPALPVTPPPPAPPAPGFAPASQGPVQVVNGVLSEKPPLPEGMQQ